MSSGVCQLEGVGDEDFIRLARNITVAIASSIGFSADGCDEACVLVDEACTGLLSSGARDLQIRFDPTSGLSVRVSTLDPVQLELDVPRRMVLASLSDDLGYDGTSITFMKAAS